MTAPKLLVVSDDTKFLSELSVYLISNGFAVIPVHDGYQALEYAIR